MKVSDDLRVLSFFVGPILPWLVGWLVGWFGRLVGWLCWLVGWLVPYNNGSFGVGVL